MVKTGTEAARLYFEDGKMFRMEFMVLYLGEIVMAALLLLGVSLLVWLVGVIAGWIGRILKKGGKRHGEGG